MSDEGFREIQLNGKQLIFLFMAVTVVLVVTFLFGVLVGRDAREGASVAQSDTNEVAPDPGLAPAADTAAPPAAGGGWALSAAAARPGSGAISLLMICAVSAPSLTLRPVSTPSRNVTTSTTVTAMNRKISCLPLSCISRNPSSFTVSSLLL